MVVWRTAYKVGDDWLMTGLEYPDREAAHQRAASSRAANPSRDVIVVTYDNGRDNPAE